MLHFALEGRVGPHELRRPLDDAPLERLARVLERELVALALRDVRDRPDVAHDVPVLVLQREHVAEHPDDATVDRDEAILGAEILSVERGSLPFLHDTVTVLGV